MLIYFLIKSEAEYEYKKVCIATHNQCTFQKVDVKRDDFLGDVRKGAADLNNGSQISNCARHHSAMKIFCLTQQK